MLVCGVDIGSTNLKVALVGDGGKVRAIRTAPTPRTRDAVGPVTDAAALVRLIEAMIVAAWQEGGGGARIAAIATSGVGEDGVCVDAALEPVAPAIPWFDDRAAAEARELAASLAATPRAGIVMEPTRTAPKWLWMARHRPGDRGTWIALTDYPLARWGAAPFMSDTLASRTGCFDAGARDWIAPMLAASAAPPLPPVVAAGTVVGTLRGDPLLASGAATELTLLVAGGHDHPVAAHAVHCLAPDARVDSIGTANVVYGEAPRFEPTQFDPILSFMAAVEGPDTVACVGVFEFSAAVAAFPGGADAVRRVMDVSTIRGEPTVPSDPPFASERQLLEWATFGARRMLERLDRYGVPDGPVFATGGWSRSRALLELRASIFGRPVHAPVEKELAVLGAAMLAMRAAGGTAALDTAVAVVEPNEAWRRRYAAA